MMAVEANSTAKAEGRLWYCGYARYALTAGLQAANLGPGDGILIPKLICKDVLPNLSDLGLKVIYYNVDDQLRVKREYLIDHMKDAPKALLVVDYFGFIQDYHELGAFCRQQNMVLIEDSAHSFIGESEGEVIGSFGDIAIYSYRKNIPLVNGAALRVNNDALINPKILAEKQNSLRMENNTYKKIKTAISRRFPLLRRIPKNRKQVAKMDADLYDYAIDAKALRIIKRYNVAREADRRRRRFFQIIENVKRLKPVYDTLPSGFAPSGVPFYFFKKDECLLRDGGLPGRTFLWPDYPAGLESYRLPCGAEKLLVVKTV